MNDILLIGNNVEFSGKHKGVFERSFSKKDLGEASYTLSNKISHYWNQDLCRQPALCRMLAVVEISRQMSSWKDLVVEPSRQVSLKGVNRQRTREFYTSSAPTTKVKAYV